MTGIASHRVRRADQAGFTLLEVLIALTLFGLLSVLLFGGLRLGTAAWDKTERVRTATIDLEAAHRVIRQELEQAYPLILPAGPDATHVAFAGAAGRMLFAALPPARLGLGGYHLISLVAEPDDGGQGLALVLRWRLADAAVDRWPLAEGVASYEAPLVAGLAEIDFSYFGSLADEPPAWHRTWDVPDALPQLVRVVLMGRDGRRRPDLVVVLRQGAARLPSQAAINRHDTPQAAVRG